MPIERRSFTNHFGTGYEKGYKDGYAKAITEFAERLHELCGMQIGDYQYDDVLHESRIDEIATELKGE